jgi:protein involved in polysaccharide export with SLBB domain
VNLAKEAARQLWKHAAFAVALVFLACLPGCGDSIRTATAGQRTAFEEEAHSVESTVDMDCLQTAKLYTGPYRVVPGDVLEFTMPALLQGVTAARANMVQTQARNDHPYICRVSPRGRITLPAVDEVEVAGRSLAEIEEEVIDAYREYVAVRPSVFVRVLEYKMCRVSITGAVVKPGVYSLRQDQMSLASLLMEAGGVIEGGAAVIRIGRLKPTGTQSANRTLAPKLPPAREPQEGGMTTGSRPSAAIPQPARTAADSNARVVFQREGPLNATGWLAWEPGGQLPVRRWLDLGNGLQRQAFVGAVAVHSRWAAADTLEARLAVLAGYLESQPDYRSGGSNVPPSGWELTGQSQFVAHLRGAVTTAEGDPWNAPVTRPAGAANTEEVTTLVVPVRTMNIPLRDVALEEGDAIWVERMAMPMFCVLGLVNRPGNYPYPPMAEYNVTQAIAFAGGLNPVADPRYVTIYRLAHDGSIVRVPFQLIGHGEFTNALATPIRPGDVVAVENTLRTRMNTIINSLVRVNVGVYLAPKDLWERQ